MICLHLEGTRRGMVPEHPTCQVSIVMHQTTAETKATQILMAPVDDEL